VHRILKPNNAITVSFESLDSFFKKVGASPHPLHQNDAHGRFIKTKYVVSRLQFTDHRVATKISQ
jgi:hypothetical protein